MAESRLGKKPELVVPERVGLFERQYRRDSWQPYLVPMDPAVVPPHAISRVQESLNWVAENMVKYPTCESSDGYRVDPEDPRGRVSYVVKRVG